MKQQLGESAEAAASLINEAKVCALLNSSGGAPHFFGIISEREAIYQLLTLPPAVTSVRLGDGRRCRVSLRSATLDHLLKDKVGKQMTAHDWLFVCKDVCVAVQQLHFHKMLHNDIKTNNVMVELPLAMLDATMKKGQWPLVQVGVDRPMGKLADFGMVTSISKDCRWRVSSNKHFYAPELRGEKSGLLSKASDAWSLGCLFAKMAETLDLKAIHDVVPMLMKDSPADRSSISIVEAVFDRAVFQN